MMFWSGIFMVIVSFAVFVIFCHPHGREWLEDACAAVMMMGFGIAVIGALLWIGRILA